MSLVSIIDLGTGSIRNTIYNFSGEIMAVAKRDNPLLRPQPNWVEQDPSYWWEAIRQTFLEIDPMYRKEIRYISATSQREGIVPVNHLFEPLSNIIIWLDGRTNLEALEILEHLTEDKLFDITGLVPNPAWSLSKILWIKKHQKNIYQEAYKLLQAEDYILSRMSGKAVTEFSIASRTCLLDVVNRQWSTEILKLFDIEIEKLPTLHEPGTNIGRIHRNIARELSLPEETEIIMGAGDQQAAAVGVGAIEEGMVSIGIGTSSALSMTLDKPLKITKQKIILNCAALPGKWEFEPPIWNTGGLIKWFLESVKCTTESYPEVLKQVEAIPAGSEGLIVLPYFSGAGSPRWNPDLKGAFLGLALHHNQFHMLRAIMESIAFEIKLNIEVIQSSGIRLKKVILSGGASQNKPLCQIISDVLQMQVEVFTETEASSRGVFKLVQASLNVKPGVPMNSEPDKSLPLDIKPNIKNKITYEKAYTEFKKLGDMLETNIKLKL